MNFVDLIVNRSFRNQQEGRVVVFDGVGRGRGYLLRSAADEQRIRAFLRMYVFAELAIQLLGTLLVAAWLSSVFGATGRPTLERELMRGGFFLAAYTLVVGLPFFLMWRAYRQAAPSFVSPADAVPVSWQPMDRTQRIALALLVLVALAAVLAVIHSCALASAVALR
jgi:Na+/proline symporter